MTVERRIQYLGAHGAKVRTDPVVSRKGLLYSKEVYKLSSDLFGLSETPCPYGQMSTRLQQVPDRNGYYKY